MAAIERSLSDVLQDVVRNLQEIIRAEARLAKTEVRQEFEKAKPAGTLLGAGALFGIFATFFVLLAMLYALARVEPDWAAALTVAAFAGIIAAVTISAGRIRLKLVNSTPEKTVASMKENVEWAKQQIK